MDKKTYTISLTGPDSHTVSIPLAQGSFSIGIKGVSKGQFDVMIDGDAPVRWAAFDKFQTPAGSPWPRFFHYFGNDTGFVEWSRARPVEDFFWHPYKPVSADLSKAQINRLLIHVADRVKLILGDRLNYLSLSGNLEQAEIAGAARIPFLYFTPTPAERGTPAIRLPVFGALREAESVDISVASAGPAFDCESLLQFPGLANLNLSGCLANLACLRKFEKLERIGIRYAPCLEGFPPLDTWKRLKSFIGWNIEEGAGKRLKTELKVLAAARDLDYSTVSKLRKAIWFVTEYGLPFSAWDEKNAKAAVKAYKAALKEIKKAKTRDEARQAIAAFVAAINELPNIETSEREDAGTAVSQLAQASGLDIPQETWNDWFDELRDF
jgi:hypothetical protein